MIAALSILGAIVVFLLVAFVAVYTQIIRPMREQLAKQEDTIARNAGATIGLFFSSRNEINKIAETVGMRNQPLVHAATMPMFAASDDEPLTIRQLFDECPTTKRSSR